jgi:glycerol-3-phosphate dehydrogenase
MLSREHAVVVAESGLVTVTGGKWTTYRVMAKDAVDHAARVAGLAQVPCPTADLRLHGWRETPADSDGSASVYGSDLPDLQKLIEAEPGGADRLAPALPYVAGEVAWAARHEAARTVEDVLARRTRALFLDARAAVAAAPRAAEILARELGRDDAWRDDQVRRFEALAAGYLPPGRGAGS